MMLMAAPQAILSQDSLESILARLPFGLMALDLKGNVLSCNPAAQAILERRFGWRRSEAPDFRRLPREIQTAVEFLCEASRQRSNRRSALSLTLTSSDLYLHLFLLPPKGKIQGSGSKTVSMVVVLHSQAPSLSEPWEKPASLTPREQEVLHWLVRGKTRKEISIILGLSEATVRTYLEHLYAKLGVHNKMEAANAASQQHLIESLGGTLRPS
jgi:DNA-binding CsgD family transcriptional regulator